MKTKKELAEQRKRERLYNRVKKMIYTKRAIFLTLTFNDRTLERTSKATRQRYIREYLNSQTAEYIANIDYGKNKGREHYHAIAIKTTLSDVAPRFQPFKDKIDLSAYKYGEIDAYFLVNKWNIKTQDGFKKISEKMTAHFIKDTTKREKIIFSRRTPSNKEQIRRLESEYKTDLKRQKIEQTKQEIADELDEIYNPKTEQTIWLKDQIKKGLI